MYADNTAVVVGQGSATKAENIMQHVFNVIPRWSLNSGLTIYAKKTNLLHIRCPYFPTKKI